MSCRGRSSAWFRKRRRGRKVVAGVATVTARRWRRSLSNVRVYVVAASSSIVRARRPRRPTGVSRSGRRPGSGLGCTAWSSTNSAPTASRTAVRHRLREHEGCEESDLTGPNPVSEASNGSKFHLIMERTGPLLSIGISGANVHARVRYPPRPDAVGRPSCTSTRRTPTGLCAAGSGQEKNPCLRRRATRPTASTPTTTTQRRLVETSGTPRVPGCGRSRYSPRPGL